MAGHKRWRSTSNHLSQPHTRPDKPPVCLWDLRNSLQTNREPHHQAYIQATSSTRYGGAKEFQTVRQTRRTNSRPYNHLPFASNATSRPPPSQTVQTQRRQAFQLRAESRSTPLHAQRANLSTRTTTPLNLLSSFQPPTIYIQRS